LLATRDDRSERIIGAFRNDLPDLFNRQIGRLKPFEREELQEMAIAVEGRRAFFAGRAVYQALADIIPQSALTERFGHPLAWLHGGNGFHEAVGRIEQLIEPEVFSSFVFIEFFVCHGRQYTG
jgi:hypothetical protein